MRLEHFEKRKSLLGNDAVDCESGCVQRSCVLWNSVLQVRLVQLGTYALCVCQCVCSVRL